MSSLSIRPETPDDAPSVARDVEAAFETDAESRLVESIRTSDRFIRLSPVDPRPVGPAPGLRRSLTTTVLGVVDQVS